MANCTHLIQPKDVVMFLPMKIKWAKIIQDFKGSNPDLDRMTRPDFCRLLNSCLNDVLQPQLLKKSFEATRIYPFGADFFDFSKLLSQNDNIPEEYSESLKFVIFFLIQHINSLKHWKM